MHPAGCGIATCRAISSELPVQGRGMTSADVPAYPVNDDAFHQISDRAAHRAPRGGDEGEGADGDGRAAGR